MNDDIMIYIKTFSLKQNTNTQTLHSGNSSNIMIQDGQKPHQHHYHQHSRTLPRMDNSNGDNRRLSAQLIGDSQPNDGSKNPNSPSQNHILERSLDNQTPIPPLPPTRTAHIHTVNNRKSLSFAPAVMVPKMDTFNSNHIAVHSRVGMNGSDMDGNSSSSSPPTDSISQKTSKIVAATATMPRNINGPYLNGRKKKSVTIGTFTTVETFDPSSYEAAAV